MARLGRSMPIRPTILRAPVAPGLLYQTLTDNFDDNSVDTGKWPNNAGTTSETGGRARVECSTGFSSYGSGQIYGLPGSVISTRVYSPAASTATSAYGEIYVTSDQVASGTAISFRADAATGLLSANLLVGGVDGGASTVAYSPASPIYLRVTATAGNLVFDYSTDGYATIGWTTLRTVAWPDWTTTATTLVRLQGHRDAGVTDFVEFDDFNILQADPIPAQPPKVNRAQRYRPIPPGAIILRAPDVRVPPTFEVGFGLDGTVPLPISCRLKTDVGDVLLVDEIKNFGWRTVKDGGFASAFVEVDKKLTEEYPEIKLFGRMYFYATDTGETHWEGEVQDPGKSSGPDGNWWRITAVGGSGHARDEKFSWIAIDQTLNHFEKFGGSKANTSIGTSTDNSDNDGIKVSVPGGVAIGSPAYVSARSLRVYNAGQDLARVTATWYSSDTSPSWEARMYVYTDGGGAELIDSSTITTTPTTFTGVVGTDFTLNANSTHLRMDKITASSTPTDEVNVFWYEIIIQTTRVDEEGNAVTSYPNDYITTSEAVQHLIGAHTTLFDALDAYIEVTSDEITQLAYDTTTFYDAMNDLIALNGAYYWQALETIPRSGLWRIEFRPLPTEVRYEASAADGWDQPGSAAEIYNRVLVHWVDKKGREQTTIRTSTVKLLDDAGRTRTAELDLGEEIGTLAQAETVGDNFLAERSRPTRNGRLRIARPVLDRQTGMMVAPARVRPPYLIRLTDVVPDPSAFTATDTDGKSVFRIIAVDAQGDGSVLCDLDSDSLSTQQLLAEQGRKRTRGAGGR